MELDSTVWIGASAQGNPYLTRLNESIESKSRFELETVHPTHRIMRKALLDGAPNILHLHWLGMYFLPGEQPDSYVISSGRVAGFIQTLKWLKARGTRLVWTAHNLYNHEKRLFWLDRFCHHRVSELTDGIIAHSERAAEIVKSTYALGDETDVAVIPHGHYIDAYPEPPTSSSVRDRLGIPDDATLFLNFGRIRHYKNAVKLLETFREAQFGDEAHLIVAGNPRTEALKKQLHAAKGRADNVHLLDKFIPDRDVRGLFEAADVTVFPYETILTSGSAVLAMSLGCPVIAPKMGTVRDILAHQSELLYNPTQTESGLLARLKEVTADSGGLADIGEKNVEQAREWGWDRIGAKTTNFYKTLLEF
jgi:glycosyltransferase involved in cell wall biosynthesis